MGDKNPTPQIAVARERSGAGAVMVKPRAAPESQEVYGSLSPGPGFLLCIYITWPCGRILVGRWFGAFGLIRPVWPVLLRC